MISLASQLTQRTYAWTAWKAARLAKLLITQYEDDGTAYTIWGYDGPEVHLCTIWKSTVPYAIVTAGYSQTQNDSDKTDFEANFLPTANASIVDLEFRDPRVFRFLGNLTAASVSEVIVYPRTYAEPASEAQRSVVSTSANDTAAGSGAKKVRIVYLTSAYVKKTEDVTMNGTTPVNTVGVDIRFIESIDVISGAAAAGAITLKTTTGGGGTEIAGIGVATFGTMFAHHYVPAGKTCYLRRWGVTVDDECSVKLMGQDRRDGVNLVDRNVDLEKLFFGNPTPPTRLTFDRIFIGGTTMPEKSYIRITVVPNQATSTVIRAFLVVWEE